MIDRPLGERPQPNRFRPGLGYAPPRVLLVDGEVDARDAYAVWLRQYEFAVSTAATAEHALERARADRPDVVVTELVLPPRGGADLIRVLLGDPATRYALVIVLTTQNSRTRRDEATAAGAHMYLVKPCAPRLLVEVMASVSLAQSRRPLDRPAANGESQPDVLTMLAHRARAIQERLPVEPLRRRVGDVFRHV